MIVFTNGCFDLFHVGHAEFLRACRALGSKLIVGLNSDDSVRRLKGPLRPICSEDERSGVLQELKSVDEVIIFNESTPCELIQRIRPDVIVKGPGYSEANMPEAAIVHSYGGRVVILEGPQISSTMIMERILDRCSQTNGA
ncbi:adenylyltransferase/cytidyltransferase family protein [Schlesneria sp. T3-172]|uniref:adenylyltransferase/cytidyltransferase family protein n=1 Tax=Schlesneria sphaerica TaxID=3373610 RepID=UPI0037C5ECB7